MNMPTLTFIFSNSWALPCLFFFPPLITHHCWLLPDVETYYFMDWLSDTYRTLTSLKMLVRLYTLLRCIMWSFRIILSFLFLFQCNSILQFNLQFQLNFNFEV